MPHKAEEIGHAVFLAIQPFDVGFYEVGGNKKGYMHFKSHNTLCTVMKQVFGFVLYFFLN